MSGKKRVSKAGLVHDADCLSLTHDGDCDCPRPFQKVKGLMREDIARALARGVLEPEQKVDTKLTSCAILKVRSEEGPQFPTKE